jgi:bla regulator protein blaR1
MMDLLESLLSAEFIRAFAWTLFHSLWQGALLALIAGAFILILRKYRPVVRYTIFYLLLMLLPVMFIATFLLTYHPGPQATRNREVNQPGNVISDENPAQIASSDGNNTTTWYSAIAGYYEGHASWFVLIWFTGFLFFLVRFTGSLFYVYRLKNNHIYDVDEGWNDHLKRLGGRIGLSGTVRLAESGLARIPMTIGYLKPVILLPLGTLSGVPPQQIDAILLHELAHILRKDYLLNIFQSVIELLFFYHPLTWWLSGLIREEREHICDDIAVDINQDHLNYIKALTTMEELNAKSPLLASAMNGSKKKLLCRVKRLLTPAKIRKGISEGVIAFILLIGLVFALSFNALSFIPTSYDLTGRETGERVYNYLPILPAGPDTMTAVSTSGRVKISIYTDSITNDQQKALQEMVESMDKKPGQGNGQQKHVIVMAEKVGDRPPARCEEQCKVIVINKSDSSFSGKDSMVVILNGECMPPGGNRSEFHNRHECPVPPGGPDMTYFNGTPAPGGDDMQIKVFSFKNDTIDTLIFMNPGANIDLKELEELGLDEKEMQELMKGQEMNMEQFQLSEKDLQDCMKEYQFQIEQGIPEGEQKEFQIYLNEPPEPPMHQEIEGFPMYQPPADPGEKIIRQELRDDGLIESGRKYIVEIDSKAMYINGEKQPKETWKKYNKLVEGLGSGEMDGSNSFKLIF